MLGYAVAMAEAVSYPAAAFSRTMSYLFQESDYPFVDMPFDGILGAPGMLRLRHGFIEHGDRQLVAPRSCWSKFHRSQGSQGK